jgi:hypothetical protein
MTTTITEINDAVAKMTAGDETLALLHDGLRAIEKGHGSALSVDYRLGGDIVTALLSARHFRELMWPAVMAELAAKDARIAELEAAAEVAAAAERERIGGVLRQVTGDTPVASLRELPLRRGAAGAHLGNGDAE